MNLKNETGILFKVSGEYFSSGADSNFSVQETAETAARLIEFKKLIGRPTFIVLGGGNICRGKELNEFKFKNGKADNVGMMSTVQNAILLSNVLEQMGEKVRIMAPSPGIEWAGVDPFKADKASELAKQGTLVIFSGGLGLPGFTTDMAAVMRAYQTGCDTVVKFSGVNGLFTADPKKDPKAKLIPEISHTDVVNKGYNVMDEIAFLFAQQTRIQIKIMDLFIPQKDLITPNIINDLRIGSLIR